jgi:hypothetical protein
MHPIRLTFALTLSLAAACGSDDDNAELTLSFANLPPLGDAAVYEGWLITPGGPLSTGRFAADETALTFELDRTIADEATAFVLTIEPATGDDPAPAATHLMAGPVSGGTAELALDDPAAIGSDFSTAAGDFVLATPSTADDTSDNNQGIWWLVPGATPLASLDLPQLPDGWVYEGWVVSGDGPTSTGRFADQAAVDSDGAGSTAGDDDAPPFPGQDFIDPPVDLIGLTAVISVEPDPDDDAGPFALKPLIDMTIEDVVAPALQSMANQGTAPVPTGTATIQ